MGSPHTLHDNLDGLCPEELSLIMRVSPSGKEVTSQVTAFLFV
jgi:hypothetical protein